MHWWEAPEWAKQQPMNFPRNDDGRQRVVAKEVVRPDHPGMPETAISIRVYTGSRRALQ